MIRSSVLTNSSQPYLGPPLVYLNNGILYQNVPCIARSYSIGHEEEAGFDELTFLPNRLTVRMTLSEVRLKGDSFNPGSSQNSFYTPGWDSLIINGAETIDPGNFSR